MYQVILTVADSQIEPARDETTESEMIELETTVTEMSDPEMIDHGMTGEEMTGKDVIDEGMNTTTEIEINPERTDIATEGTIENETEIINEREVEVPIEASEDDRMTLIENDADEYPESSASTPSHLQLDPEENGPTTVESDEEFTPNSASLLFRRGQGDGQ